MLALYRDGRQGEALAAYQQARRVLVAELGTEPGTELRELHQQMLAADPALSRRPAAGPAAAGSARTGPAGSCGRAPGGPPVPRQLPAAVRAFRRPGR